MAENWIDIEDYQGIYQISNKGEVKSLQRIFKRKNGSNLTICEKKLKHNIDSNGYPFVRLYKESKGQNKKIHRLVAISFIENPTNLPIINHINGIKTEFSISNLEWCSYSENNTHAYRTGLRVSVQTGLTGSKSQHAKKIIQQDLNGNDIKTWDSIIEVEREHGFAHENISKVLVGKRKTAYSFKWKYYE